DEQESPRIRPGDGHLVRTGDDEVALKAVGKGRPHRHREKAGGREAVEPQHRQRRDGGDHDDEDDENGVRDRRQDLQGAMRRGVDEDYGEMREYDADEDPVESVHPPAPRPGMKPSARHASTTWRKPSRTVGYRGTQPSSRRNFAEEVRVDRVRKSSVSGPRASRASQRGTCLGAGAPNASANAMKNSARDT